MRTPTALLALVTAGGAVAALTIPATAVATSTTSATSTPRTGPPPVGHDIPKVPVMTGGGGAVATVDPIGTQVGIDILEKGGTAADAAVAAAAAIGAVEPYSSGIGGGGFFVHYDAETGEVTTIDGRETAPATFHERVFRNPDGSAMDFDTVVNSGLSVGVPGTPATWAAALERHGRMSLNKVLKPAEDIARKGFVVDEVFHQDTLDNAERFSMFPATAEIYLPGGAPIPVGGVQRNPDLAKAYRELRTHGIASLHTGRMGQAVVKEVQNPTTATGVTVPRGQLTAADLAAYKVNHKAPTHTEHNGVDVYGMGTPSSGGIAVSEILNLLESFEERTGRTIGELSEAEYLHWFSEASAMAFADRNRYVGDVPGVPTAELTSQQFADERSCLFDPDTAQARPVPFGSPDGAYDDSCQPAGTSALPRDGQSTTSLTVTDKWGDVVTYTLTIEQFGGSGIVVPGWGFLLNNELTDFNFAPLTPGVPDPNLPGPGKRPRSSMSPTIVLQDGKPYLTAGSPGGATIITTVAQIVAGVVDRGLSVGDAVAAPRISSRNGTEDAETPIFATSIGDELRVKGHVLRHRPVIGNGTAIRSLSPTLWTAAAEPVRRGGGSAAVVNPR
ncbi:gamma-glutamyltransferase [Knoellia sinensis KCTC 19936]|uniref:Glutathione hydrolase proenzyme n=1 Tax=Knoellia sinensis KCTC 19936 TaxID=1385520 RepID=A0A0A0JF34_9MICO|nr:gamma-glutamyltransferase [Knoellia sinensis]KGN34662.1 gamma-glutamyltransferase [Knoellia sinensis KCTC 19936]